MILEQVKMICNSLLTIYLHLIEINLFMIFTMLSYQK
jgi:hypothetical protein